jgi:hypothetical protein
MAPECRSCGRPIDADGREPGLARGEESYHLHCAPTDVVRDATEEWNAIVRKGVRYFIEKYVPAELRQASKLDPMDRSTAYGEQFVAVGLALQSEVRRREIAPGAG